MEVTPGRVVLYVLSDQDIETISIRRSAIGCYGNDHHAGDVVPLIVVRVWPNEYGDKPGINGQALLDGDDALWITSAGEGDKPGRWYWPPRAPEADPKPDPTAPKDTAKKCQCGSANAKLVKHVNELTKRLAEMEARLEAYNQGAPHKI